MNLLKSLVNTMDIRNRKKKEELPLVGEDPSVIEESQQNRQPHPPNLNLQNDYVTEDFLFPMEEPRREVTGFNKKVGKTGIWRCEIEGEFYCHWCYPEHPFALYCISMQLALFEMGPKTFPLEGLPTGQASLSQPFVFKTELEDQSTSSLHEDSSDREKTPGVIFNISDPTAIYFYLNREYTLSFESRLMDVISECLKNKQVMTKEGYQNIISGLYSTDELTKIRQQSEMLSLSHECIEVLGNMTTEDESVKKQKENLIRRYNVLNGQLNRFE